MLDIRDKDFSVGMDLSFMDEIEHGGGRYFDELGQERELLELVKEKGVNAVRLRIWNDPVGGFCNLERTVPIAKRIKQAGLRFLLDFHYSDKWADPANQWKPAAWETFSFEQLGQAVYDYTAEVLDALKKENALPDMVQVGNEITPGMLWNEGKVDGEAYDNDRQWEQFAGLVKRGIEAVHAASTDIRVMIHIDRGGDNASSVKFFDRFEELQVEFDVIGQSFYPWWHGTLDALRDNLHDLAARYGKPINVVETAYPWTLEEPEGSKWVMNGKEGLLPLPEYPPTAEGQQRYLEELIAIVRAVPNGLGEGFYYWEPAWIPSQKEWSVGHPNNWANLTMFDFEGKALKSFAAFAGQTAK
nr:arabinogalactan endo-1,4-beta-galactosidase [Saccharibacillus sacchari]